LHGGGKGKKEGGEKGNIERKAVPGNGDLTSGIEKRREGEVGGRGVGKRDEGEAVDLGKSFWFGQGKKGRKEDRERKTQKEGWGSCHHLP